MDDGKVEVSYDALRLENQLCFPLYACSRQIVKAYCEPLKPLGLTYTQYLVMLVLWEKRSIPMNELCTLLYLDSGTLTPVLRRLEERALIIKERSGQDARTVLVSVTDDGMALREEARNVPQKVGSCINIDPKDAKALYALLYKLLK